jgi:hypothetical protein
MAEPRDPHPPDSDVVESSTTDEERWARRCLFRHQLFFMLGIFVFIVVGFFAMGNKLGALSVTIGAGVCWMLSGVYAIEGRRHMFAGARMGSFGQMAIRPNKGAGTGAIVVGVILIVLGVIGFGNVAWWIWRS